MYSSVFKIFLLITFIFYSCLVSAAEQTDDENIEEAEPTPVNPTVIYTDPLKLADMLLRDIKRFVPQHQVEVLTTNTGEEFISLVKPQTTGLPKGIAFILPDIDQTVHRQAATSSLFNQLSDYGWHSMILTMPFMSDIVTVNTNITEPNDPKSPIQEQAADNVNQQSGEDSQNTEPDDEGDNSAELDSAEDSNSDDDIDPEVQNDELYRQLQIQLPATFVEPIEQLTNMNTAVFDKIEGVIAERLSAAIQVASSEPGFYLMICQGRTCVWLTEAIVKGLVPQPDALIMLSANFPEVERNRKFAETLAQTDFPTLDLYLSRDNRWVNYGIEWRRKMARRHFKTEYRQRQVFNLMDYGEQQRRVLKEIYGFTHSVGM